MRFVGLNDRGQNCYSFTQSQIGLYNTLPVEEVHRVSGYKDLTHGAGDNKILMYFIATPEESPNASGVFYHTIKTIKINDPILGTGVELQISQDLTEFSEYVISNINENNVAANDQPDPQ